MLRALVESPSGQPDSRNTANRITPPCERLGRTDIGQLKLSWAAVGDRRSDDWTASQVRVRLAHDDERGALIDFPGSPWVRGLPTDQLADDFAKGRMHTQWSVVAEIDGRLVARCLWWGTSEEPSALDALDVLPEIESPGAIAERLLREGLGWLKLPQAPPYTLGLHSDWREHARAREAVRWRSDAVATVGLTHVLERRQYEWTPKGGRVAPTGRLSFEPATDAEFC